MITFGIIGTGAISHQFIQAAHASGAYQLTAVYSRKLSTAQDFAANYSDTQLYDDLAAFLEAEFDLVYIASPNSLHASLATKSLLARKHVIVEKPAVTHPDEWLELTRLAREQDCFLFEAARNYHEVAFQTIQDFLADQTILGADFRYAKYSSKMPELLSGQMPNVFSNRFAGGALMDLGVYPVYACVRLFEKPSRATYQAQQLENTIDLNGDGILFYPDFQVSVKTGKNLTSQLACEIYTSTGTLVLDSIEHIQSAVFITHDGTKTPLDIQRAPEPMDEEVRAFANAINRQDKQSIQKWHADALIVHQLLYRMRQSAMIYFESETHE